MGALALVAPPASAVDTHPEFVAEASDVCRALDRQAKKIARKIPPGDDPFAASLKELLLFNRALGKATRRIDSIGPAPGFEQPVEKWTDGLRRQRRFADRYVAAVKRGQVRRAQVSLKKAAKAAAQNSESAEDLGIGACK